MAKIFQFDARNRSFADKVSGVVPVNTNCTFKRTEKGYALDAPGGVNAELNFGDICDVGEDDFTVYIVIKASPQATYPLVLEKGSSAPQWGFGFTNLGGFYIYLQGTSGPMRGYWPVTVKLDGMYHFLTVTINRGGLMTVYWDNVLDGTKDISAVLGTLNHLGQPVCIFHKANNSKADIPFVRVVKGVASASERAAVYQEFLHSSPTSSPTIIRPEISVGSTGSVLCHNYQLGNAADLSGNGNDGIPSGFVDYGIDGAVLHGTDYIEVADDPSFNFGASSSFTILALINPNSLATYRHIVGKSSWDLNNGDKLYVLTSINNGKIRGFLCSGGGFVANLSTIPMKVGENNLVGMVVNRSTQKMIAWTNGIPNIVPTDISGIGDIDNTKKLYIGTVHSKSSKWQGGLKWVKIIPRALSDVEMVIENNKIASLNDLHVMDRNLLPDGQVIPAGGYIDA